MNAIIGLRSCFFKHTSKLPHQDFKGPNYLHCYSLCSSSLTETFFFKVMLRIEDSPWVSLINIEWSRNIASCDTKIMEETAFILNIPQSIFISYFLYSYRYREENILIYLPLPSTFQYFISIFASVKNVCLTNPLAAVNILYCIRFTVFAIFLVILARCDISTVETESCWDSICTEHQEINWLDEYVR